jgi:ATP-binding cassette subfamily B protein
MRRIDKVLRAQPKVVEKEGALDAHGLEPSVQVRGLTFRYPNPPSIVFDASGGRMSAAAAAAAAKASKNGSKAPKAEGAPAEEELPIALHDIDLNIEPGKTLGVVGPIGAGKSTLAKLFSRLYPFEDGKVFLGGHDVNGLTFDALRRQVGYVFQETFLFSASIADNVRYGRPEATDEEVERACRIASLHEDIARLPKGYQTMLGERGINLSGGQKQRAAIARALIYDPKVLILDDALSAVDSETEEKILNALRGENKARTVIIIAHRLSTLRGADEIVVLDKGRIVERGGHASLVEAGGLYAKLHHMQQLEAEIAAQA